MSTTNNSMNNTIGSPATNNFLSQIRSTSGQWQEFDDQTDVHGYYSGVGSPEGVVTANPGSWYNDTNDPSSGMYQKNSGVGNTGWTIVGGGSSQLVAHTLATSSTPIATSTIIPLDNTIPQNTEGAQYMTVVHTPQAAGNILVVEFSSYLALPAVVNLNATVALFNGASANAFAAIDAIGINNVSTAANVYICGTQTAASTAAITFAVRFGPSSANSITMNGGGGATSLYGGVGLAMFRVSEYLP